MTTTALVPTSNRRTPWAALGTDISGAANVTEALDLAGLNWGLDVHPASNFTLFTEDGLIDTGLDNRRFILRNDTHRGLAAVGERYSTIDNATVGELADVVKSLGGKFGHAGELDGGRRVFFTVDLPDATVELGNGKDLVSFSTIIQAGHDGRAPVSWKVDGRRLWCTNGCTAQIKGIAHKGTIRHAGDPQLRISEARDLVRDSTRYAKEFGAVASHLLDTKMSEAEFKGFIDGLFPEPDAEQVSKHTRWDTRRGELLKLWKFADTNDLGRGTRWGAFNSVTEFLDWGQTLRPAKGVDAVTQRARRGADDANEALKSLALEELLVTA
jgi:phage/plasmid-like protein (TIGR03299 family)